MIDEPTIIGGAGGASTPDPVGDSASPVRLDLDATLLGDASVGTDGSGAPTMATAGNPFRPRGLKLASGTTIGVYRIARLLGEGGFGVVYQAEQERPVKRTVALKLVKPGMDTADVLARFDAERQALARMEHPCVATVLDAGVTEDERPYFAMEFVRGDPLVTFCDQERLSVRERIEIFIRVCEAIQHAHAKGVVHRDLKPANILCARGDSGIVPKVIDFGIAKALGERLGETTLHTAGGLMIGTPDYMSPEQADGADIDTRTDVYALGATLYQLLAGLLPFDPEALRGGGYGQMRRLLVEVMPPRPSERLRAVGAAQPAESGRIATERSTTTPALLRALRDDLDWICLKCLAKDRDGRYDSPGSLARDLRRHLDGMPVSAGPPSRIYLARKFAARHRVGVVVSAVVVGLVVASAITFAQLYRESKVQFERAERQRRHAEETLTTFQQALGAVDPSQGRGSAEMRMADFLDLVERELDARMASQPDALASLRTTIGLVRLSFGDATGARRALDAALQQRRAAAVPGDSASQELLAEALHNDGRALYLTREFDRAYEAYSESLEVRRQLHSGDHPGLALTLQHLASVQRERGELRESTRLLDDSIAMWTRLGGVSMERARAVNNRGVLRERQHDYYAAEADYVQALEVASQALDADDVLVARMHANLGRVRSTLADHDGAIPELELALSIKRRRLSDANPQTVDSARELIRALNAAGRPVPPSLSALLEPTHDATPAEAPAVDPPPATPSGR